VVTAPAAAIVSGILAVVVACWVGVGERAGCVVLGLAGVAMIVVGVAAVLPDRRNR